MSMYGQFSPKYADNCKLFQKILFKAELHSSFGDWRRGWSFENLLSLLRSNCLAFVKLSNCLTLNGLQRAKFDGKAFQNFEGPCESLTYHSSPGHRTMNRQQDIDHLPAAPVQGIVLIKLQGIVFKLMSNTEQQRRRKNPQNTITMPFIL